MKRKLIRVTEENESSLIQYCADHGGEHDGSYLPGRDFRISVEYPSYLLMEDKKVLGAVCLMRTKRFLSVNKGRFSIFHSVLNTENAYTQLLEGIRPHLKDMHSVYLFIPEEKQETPAILKKLGFQIERYSFVLERGGDELREFSFPDGFTVHQINPSDQVGINQFAACLNEEFKELAGHTPSAAEDIQTWFEESSYLEGGLCLLKKEGQEPIGTISLMRDLENLEAGEILAFGILKKYRGLELGRNLLRYGINFLIGKKFNPVILSVNGENHKALSLYQSEGFNLTESFVCYTLDCSQ
ncbi:MAG: GNAT family N-acetyltransferase [Anaerolineales bacterium]